jgi:hypothetical protein
MRSFAETDTVSQNQWLTTVILGTWEAGLRKLMVGGQPRQ